MNEQIKNFKVERKEYFVTLDGKPVCPAFNDEHGLFDGQVKPLYDALVTCFSANRVKIVCITTLDIVGHGIEEK